MSDKKQERCMRCGRYISKKITIKLEPVIQHKKTGEKGYLCHTCKRLWEKFLAEKEEQWNATMKQMEQSVDK